MRFRKRQLEDIWEKERHNEFRGLTVEQMTDMLSTLKQQQEIIQNVYRLRDELKSTLDTPDDTVFLAAIIQDLTNALEGPPYDHPNH